MHLIHEALAQYGYVAAFLLVWAGAANLPVPGGLVIVFAGALVPRGYFQFEALLLLLATASVLGDAAAYGLSRRLTTRSTWERRTTSHAALARLERYLKKRPLLTVAGSRFVPLVNGGVNSLAGMCRLAPLRFAVGDVIGNTAFVGCYLFLGLVFGRTWGDAASAATVGGGIGLLIGGFTIAGILMLRRDGSKPPPPSPPA